MHKFINGTSGIASDRLKPISHICNSRSITQKIITSKRLKLKKEGIASQFGLQKFGKKFLWISENVAPQTPSKSTMRNGIMTPFFHDRQIEFRTIISTKTQNVST